MWYVLCFDSEDEDDLDDELEEGEIVMGGEEVREGGASGVGGYVIHCWA